MKVMVTGSNGLIGKEVVRLLHEKKVDVVDCHLGNGCDILHQEQVENRMKGCQAVIHLAAIINEEEKEETIYRVNIEGTKKVLDAATKSKVERIVFTSSVGVYGNTPEIKNEQTPIAPTTPYEKSKVEAEKLVEQYQELISYTIVRSALVLGPNEYWKQIFHMVRQNKPIPGEGKNTWQTIYYKDFAACLVYLLFLDAAENETFLIAGEEQPTLYEFVKQIRNQYGLSGPVPTMPLWLAKLMGIILAPLVKLQGKRNYFSSGYLQRLLRERHYDLTKIHAYGWKSRYSLAETIKETSHQL